MCNPPFYSSQSEIDSSLALKEIEPFAVRGSPPLLSFQAPGRL